MTEKYTPEKCTPEEVAEVIDLLQRGDGNGCRASNATMAYAAEVLAAVSAELRAVSEIGDGDVQRLAETFNENLALKAELRQERERAEGHKSAFLMASSERFEAIKARDIFHDKAKDATYAMNEAQAERDRLHKAITEALAWLDDERLTDDQHIGGARANLRAALDKEGEN